MQWSTVATVATNRQPEGGDSALTLEKGDSTMSIIDTCIVMFILAMSVFICTCNPDGLHPRKVERFATGALCVMMMLIVAAFTYLAYLS